MDSHHREYIAAINGMAEIYGRPQPTADAPPAGCRLPSVGDWISGCTAGKRWSGRVARVWERRGTVDIEGDGYWLCVPVADITH